MHGRKTERRRIGERERGQAVRHRGGNRLVKLRPGQSVFKLLLGVVNEPIFAIGIEYELRQRHAWKKG